MKDPNVRPSRVCSPKYAVMKARKGKQLNRWELEELAKDPEYSFLYAQKVLKGRFPEGEAAIARDVDWALRYAKEIIQGRFPEAEDLMLEMVDRGHNFISGYFIDVAGEPNEKVEHKILETKNYSLAASYAEKCLKRRWTEAEGFILIALGVAGRYHQTVVKERWPEFEDAILFRKRIAHWDRRAGHLKEYLGVVRAPIPELEKKLERCSQASLILTYAVRGVRGRLPPALHQKMMMLGFDTKKQKWTKKYLKFLENCERRAVAYITQLDDESRAELFSKFLKK